MAKRSLVVNKPSDVTLEGARTVKVSTEKAAMSERELISDAAHKGLVFYNIHVDEFRALSMNPYDWVVSEVYPISKEGKLWVDRPKSAYAAAICEKKRAIMKKLGHRYIVVNQGMDLHGVMSQVANLDADSGGAFLE